MCFPPVLGTGGDALGTFGKKPMQNLMAKEDFGTCFGFHSEEGVNMIVTKQHEIERRIVRVKGRFSKVSNVKKFHLARLHSVSF